MINTLKSIGYINQEDSNPLAAYQKCLLMAHRNSGHTEMVHEIDSHLISLKSSRSDENIFKQSLFVNRLENQSVSTNAFLNSFASLFYFTAMLLGNLVNSECVIKTILFRIKNFIHDEISAKNEGLNQIISIISVYWTLTLAFVKGFVELNRNKITKLNKIAGLKEGAIAFN